MACADMGRGPTLVTAATWLTHLQHDLDSPVWAHWVRFFGEHCRYIRYDKRGCGMSDWEAGDLAQEYWAENLQGVVEDAEVAGPFALLGISQGAATAIRYAVRHPQRVSHLILYGGYAVGGSRSDDPVRRALFNAVMDVLALGWVATTRCSASCSPRASCRAAARRRWTGSTTCVGTRPRPRMCAPYCARADRPAQTQDRRAAVLQLTQRR